MYPYFLIITVKRKNTAVVLEKIRTSRHFRIFNIKTNLVLKSFIKLPLILNSLINLFHGNQVFKIRRRR
jgi:hypothetical protein